MAGYNGSGVFSYSYSWQNDAANGIPITASRMDTQFGDSTGGFNLVICRDGQSTTTAAIPFAVGIKTDTLSPVTALGPIAVPAGQLGFPAAQNPSANVNTLDDYEEGTYTPTDQSGAGIVFTAADGFYTKIGNVVTIFGSVIYPVSASGAAAVLSIPFPGINVGTNGQAAIKIIAQSNAATVHGFINKNASTMGLTGNASATITNASVANGVVYFSGTYLTAT